jgi:hypothetical protein
MPIDTPNFDYNTGLDKIGVLEMTLVAVTISHLSAEELPGGKEFSESLNEILKMEKSTLESTSFRSAADRFRSFYLSAMINIDLPSLIKRMDAITSGFRLLGYRPVYAACESVMKNNVFRELECTDSENYHTISHMKFQTNQTARKLASSYVAFTDFYFYGFE